MNDEDYSFLVDTMVWSFSRLNSFYNCKREWKLHYIDCNKSEGSAMAQFGSFVHKILEKYVKGELDFFELSDYYEQHFDEEVYLDFPPNKYVDLRESYYNKGAAYLENADLMLDQFDVLGVEKEVHFQIDDVELIGYIDLLLRDKITGEIIILDHKSATIKILKSGKISKTDQGHFESFKRQLYLYSMAVKEEYGDVAWLEWNMFKDQQRIKIPWDEKEYDDAIKWAQDTVNAIREETEWEPKVDEFYCRYLCGMRSICEFSNFGTKEEQQEANNW